MSIRIVLDNGPPEYYSNLDTISGRVLLNLNRAEQVGAVVVKLEGESRTALAVPTVDPSYPGSVYPGARGARPARLPGGISAPGQVMHENHKVLYKVQQVFPGPDAPGHGAGPQWLNPGPHSFPFRFKIPMNNMCGDPRAMAQIGGIGGPGGFTDSPGLFGIGGIRVMDGSRQLLYAHVNKQLPPTFTGLPHQAEVGYYVKVTIQRPGLLKENWRYKIDFRLMPLEPPRLPPTGQEAYARRPFAFRPRSPASASAANEAGDKKKKSFFGSGFGGKKDEKSSNNPFFTKGSVEESGGGNSAANATPNSLDPNGANGQLQRGLAPSVEMSARLPYPSVLTMGKPLPLRLMGKKLAPSRGEHVFLTSLHVELIGTTKVRCNELNNVETSRWVIVSKSNLKVPVIDPEGPVGSEITLPASLFLNDVIPSGLGQAGMTPAFSTCNLSRTLSLELKLGVSWGLRETLPRDVQPQALFLPLTFSKIDVYSGRVNPEVQAHAAPEATGQAEIAPALPPRRPSASTPSAAAGAATTNIAAASSSAAAAPPIHSPPAQVSGPGAAPEYEAPPPSYEEAMNSKT
ncbi:hypothetical protein MCOR16_001052 [Pyricularia oryzae]|nr:hypothetical protein MCOR15_007232 [Pyricularia oryzae]KAI6540215.1 hypothetical protein MCOR16_001052 [Pyricularia oryzae]